MALIAALAVALPALAALQYHWVGQVSEAELERMQSHLRQQTAQFSEEFNAAIRGAFNAIQRQGPARDRDALADPLARWMENAPERNLIRAFYLSEADDKLFVFDAA